MFRMSRRAAMGAVIVVAELDLDAIQAAAEKAYTPGPWFVDETPGFEFHVRTGGTACAVPSTGDPVAETAVPEDAAFIAAANPTVVLALVAEVRALRNQLDAVGSETAVQYGSFFEGKPYECCEHSNREYRAACHDITPLPITRDVHYSPWVPVTGGDE